MPDRFVINWEGESCRLSRFWEAGGGFRISVLDSSNIRCLLGIQVGVSRTQWIYEFQVQKGDLGWRYKFESCQQEGGI